MQKDKVTAEDHDSSNICELVRAEDGQIANKGGYIAYRGSPALQNLW